jgi:hypothetical protein
MTGPMRASMRSMRGAVLAALLAQAFLSNNASADVTKDQCVDVDTKAQSLRREGKLAEAREQLKVCIDPRCPAILREDCTQRMDELERAMPTIVFDAKDEQGWDLVPVRVAVDGHPLTDMLDGRALPVDPGEHTFTFQSPGKPPMTRRFVLKEGEKERRERIVLGATPTTAPESPPDEVPSEPASPGKAPRLAGIVLGSAGLVGIGMGAVFGALTIYNWSNSRNECRSPTNCPEPGQALADHDSAVTAARISNVAFVAGGALLAGGLALWVSGDVAAHTPVLRVSPRVGPGTAGLAATGEF